jgi:serine protease Do
MVQALVTSRLHLLLEAVDLIHAWRFEIMTQNEQSRPRRRSLVARRLSLLGSTAILGLAILAAGPGSHWNVPQIGAPAVAAEAVAQPAGFADLVAKVKPAVISVRVKLSEAPTGLAQREVPFPPGSPLEKFFRQFGVPGNGNGGKPQIVTGEGSGFFISPDGYAVTNFHVVDHSSSVKVTTDASKSYDAKVIGTDEKTDLALIKIDGNNFPYVKFADHELRIGDWVVAVGNPFGLGGTVTAGIVSARGRDIGAGPYDDFIQIDAPINKGNSGGPAFDLEGNVIGVNTAIFSPSGGSVGIGFDIPAETAKSVVAQLKDKGHVTRGWIGVQIQPVTADIADSLGMKQAQGALVAEPQADSPAAKAGIKAGDVITSVNGAPLKDAHELARKVSAMAPGTAVDLGILRNGKPEIVKLTLGQLPEQRHAQAGTNEGTTSGVPHLGLTLAPAGEVAGAGGAGVVVTAVEPGGPASEHGFQTGDVILDVAGKAVSKPADVRDQLEALRKDGKHTVLMRVKSAQASRFVAMPIG